MPYIITVSEPGFASEAEPYAVATRQEALRACRAEARNHATAGTAGPALKRVGRACALGGVIKLADGYVIDVRRYGWRQLAALGGVLRGTRREHAVSAFNNTD